MCIGTKGEGVPMLKSRSVQQARVVADIMTRSVVTLYEEDDLENVSEAMEKFRFAHVPVVDDGKLVGLITLRDLAAVFSSRLDPTGPVRDDALRKNVFVRDIMTTNVRTVKPDTPILDAARLMRDARLGCLPVVGGAGELVGIVTATDMLDLVANWLDERERARRWKPQRPGIPRPGGPTHLS
jgi:acetoin utilization protein AcuB